MPLLDELSDADRTLLLSLQRPRRFAAGERLFRQGEPADGALYLRRGTLDLQLFAPGRATPVQVHAVGPGELLGESALVADTRRMRQAVARTDVEVGVVHQMDLTSLLSAFHPGSMRIVLAIARQVAGRLQGDEQPQGMVRPLQPGPGVESSPLDPLPYLPHFPFFRTFTPEDLGALVARGRLWDVARGTVLRRRGEVGAGCLLVVRGAVGIRVGNERIGLLGPGHLAGELGALTGRPATADLVVREHGTVLELDEAAFTRLTTPDERVAFKFTNAMAAALAGSLARTNRTDARRALGAVG